MICVSLTQIQGGFKSLPFLFIFLECLPSFLIYFSYEAAPALHCCWGLYINRMHNVFPPPCQMNKLVTFHPRRLPMCDCSTTPPLDSVPSLATHLLTMWQIPPRPGTWCPFRIAGRCIHMGGGRRTRPVARSGCNLPPRRRTRNVKG